MANISIIGAGAIGSLFGGVLSEKGHEVTLIGRDPHISKVKDDGLVIKESDSEINLDIEAVKEAPDRIMDLAIVSTKAYDTEKSILEHSSVIGEDTKVLSIQNGIGNEEVIKEVSFVSEENVIGGVTSNGANLVEPGVVYWNGKGGTIVGDKEVRDIMDTSKIPVDYKRNIEGTIWNKALINCGINPLGALTNMKNGEIVEYSEEVLTKVIEEGKKVAKVRGVKIDSDPVEEAKEICRKTSENENSMLQDLKKGNRTEIDYLNGIIAKEDARTPYNEILFNLVRSIDNRNKNKN